MKAQRLSVATYAQVACRIPVRLHCNYGIQCTMDQLEKFSDQIFVVFNHSLERFFFASATSASVHLKNTLLALGTFDFRSTLPFISVYICLCVFVCVCAAFGGE